MRSQAFRTLCLMASLLLLGSVNPMPGQKPASPGGTTAARKASKAANLSWTTTRKVDIVDPQYQMTAYTMDVPTGWKFAGTIVRAGGCHANGAGLSYTLQSPDGITGVVALPGVTWSWNTSEQRRRFMEQAHCPGIDIDSATSFLVNIAIPNLHPDARVLEILPLLPEGQAALAQQLAQAKQSNAAMAQQYHQEPQKLTLDGARVRVQYQRNGQTVEEMVASVVNCTTSKQIALYNQSASVQRICSSRGTYMTRTLQGHLDELLNLPEYKTLMHALTMHHDWDNRLAADQQAAFQRFQQEDNARFQANQKANQAAFDQRIQQGKQANAARQAQTDQAIAQDRARQASIDAAAHKTALYSLDQQEFVNPNTGQTIQASSQYNHQWVSSDGSAVIQTNDHTYDPNGRVYPVSQSWTELVPK